MRPGSLLAVVSQIKAFSSLHADCFIMERLGVTSANAEVTCFYIDAFVLVTQQVTPGCGVDSVFACYQHVCAYILAG